MAEYEENDMIQLKGTVNSKNIAKVSICPNEECKAKNKAEGAFVFITPIWMEKLRHHDTKTECNDDIVKRKEISNSAIILGTLCRDPKKMKIESKNLIVTQYQIALNRKFHVRTDPPEIRSDYPWVKSYGKNAIEDKRRLHTGSVVLIDGFIQQRNVNRHMVCSCCGRKYDWKDRAMEIVPYDTEYMRDFYTDEEIEANEQKQIEEAKKRVFGSDTDTPDEDMSVDE